MNKGTLKRDELTTNKEVAWKNPWMKANKKDQHLHRASEFLRTTRSTL